MFKKLMAKLKCIPTFKILGSVLIASGAILLLCFLPGWIWGTLLGIILISTGIYFLTI